MVSPRFLGCYRSCNVNLPRSGCGNLVRQPRTWQAGPRSAQLTHRRAQDLGDRTHSILYAGCVRVPRQQLWGV